MSYEIIFTASIVSLVLSIFFWTQLKERPITKAVLGAIVNFVSRFPNLAILTVAVRNMVASIARLLSRVAPVIVRFFELAWPICKTLGGNIMTILNKLLKGVGVVGVILLDLIWQACKIFARAITTTGAEFHKSGWPVCKTSGHKIWEFLDKKPRDLAPFFVWVILTALLFKPLFGNPLSRAGWSNAFSEPTGFIVYIAIVLVTLFLIIGGVRHGDPLSEKLKSIALYSTITLLVVGGLGYFIFFTVQDSGNESKVYIQQSTPSTQHTAPQPTPFSAAQHGVGIGPSAPALSPVPSAPRVATAKLTGTEKFGIKLFDLAPGERAIVEEINRDHYSLETDGGKQYTSLWGYNDNRLANYWDGRWKPNHRYSHIEGVLAGETLLILGEVGNEKNIVQFLDGEKKVEVWNDTNEIVALILYFHGLEEYWADDSPYAFVNKNEADSYGYPNVNYKKGFGSDSQKGSATFKAEKIS